MNSISDAIKQTLSMREVAERYDYRPNRSGFITCPFHSEKSASLKIYNEAGRGFHCFGCGKSGSVIDFVMEIFGLDFRSATVRINNDFGLGLTNTKPSMRELAEWRYKKAQEERELNAYRNEYIENEKRYYDLWQAKLKLAPKPNEPIDLSWAYAMHELPPLDYYFLTHEWR